MFETKEEWVNHVHAPANQVCNVATSGSPTDPEDGISARTEDVLNGRKASDKIDTWETLWGLLFPNDEVVGDSG